MWVLILRFYSLNSYDPKGRNAAQSIPSKKKREHGEKDQTRAENNKSQDSESFSMFSSRALISEKEIEELGKLRDQVEDLQKKLSEKDELLKSAENSVTQMNAIHEKFDEVKRQAAEKDSLLKSTQLQLSDAKVFICCLYDLLLVFFISTQQWCLKQL